MRFDCLQGPSAVTWGLFSSLPAPLKGSSLSHISPEVAQGIHLVVLGLGPILGGFSRGCVSIAGGFAPLGLSVLVVAKGTGIATLCAGRGSLCLLPSVTSAEVCLFLATAITLSWGRSRAWLQQPRGSL